MTYIHVKVFPDSKRDSSNRIDSSHFEIYVKEPPKMNLANLKVKKILGEEFAFENIRLISGHHSRSKIFSVD